MKNSYPILIFDPDDNVATAIQALAAGTAVAECLQTCEQIPFVFKVALRDIPAGTYIRKYGIYIGRALQDIPAGASVHIHNVCSLCDHRSVTFKAENAAPQDMSYQLEEVRENV